MGFTLNEGSVGLVERSVFDLNQVLVVIAMPDATVHVRLLALTPPVHARVECGVHATVVPTNANIDRTGCHRKAGLVLLNLLSPVVRDHVEAVERVQEEVVVEAGFCRTTENCGVVSSDRKVVVETVVVVLLGDADLKTPKYSSVLNCYP